jgi:lipoate---protein ligase
VPDEKFRDKLYKTLSANLSTIQRETGSMPRTVDLAEALVEAYQPLLGKLTPAELDEEILAKADQLFTEMNTQEWLFENDRRRPDNRQVKIREDVYVIQKMVKLPGGLVRVNAISEAGRLRDVHISGDFFVYPANALQELEKALEGTTTQPDELRDAIQDFYNQSAITTPGILPEQLVEVLST